MDKSKTTLEYRNSQVMDLRQLIAGPLVAAVEADAMASQKYYDYLLRIAFDDYWGSERGQIWRICLLAFLKFATPLQKLFGTGINSTPFFTWDYDPKNVSTMLANYCTPHNFLLQWLIEGGIFGLGLFCLFCFLALKVAFKCKSIYHLLSSVMVIVILAGWLVTVHSPDITPYFIVFLAICAAPKNFEAGE